MRNKLKKFYFWPVAIVIGLNFFWAWPAAAICPICTVAVGAGLEISRLLGIDDLVTALWIGGLTVSLIIWTIDWLERKKFIFYAYKLITFLSYYLLVIASLYYIDALDLAANKIWGMDKIYLGIIIGSLVFWGSSKLHFYLKARNGNKVYFPFQKVAVPVGGLLIISIIFFFITK